MTSDDTSVPGADSGSGRATSPASSPDVLRLVQTFDERFAPHLERASLAVRDAELALEKAHEALVQAEQAAANKPYVSDPLVFMRASLDDEVDGLRRFYESRDVKIGKDSAYLLHILTYVREGIFDGETVERLLREHLAGRENHSHVLWTMLVFEDWRERWSV